MRTGSRDREAVSRDAAHCPSLAHRQGQAIRAACAAVLVHARAASALIMLLMVRMRMSPLDYATIDVMTPTRGPTPRVRSP